MKNKLCPDCKKKKPLSEYSLRKAGGTILVSYCKPCASVRSRAYQVKNVDKFKEYQKKYHEAKKLKS